MLPSWTSGASPAPCSSAIARSRARSQFPASSLRVVFLQQEIAEPLFETVNHLQRRMRGEITVETLLLVRLEIVPVTAHQGEQAPIPGSDRIQIAPAGEKVVIHQPNDMEAVGDNARLGKVFAHDGPVNSSQIHADHFDSLFPLEPVEISFQGSFAAAEHHVIDFVVLEIAERGGEAVLSGEEMLIDAEDPRALRSGPFARLLPQPGSEPALNGRAGNPLALRQSAAADAVQVFLTNRTAKWLTGAHPRQNARKALPEKAPAGYTTPFPGLQLDHAVPYAPAFVPRPANPQILHAEFRSPTVRTQNLPDESRCNAHLATRFFDGCNLIFG